MRSLVPILCLLAAALACGPLTQPPPTFTLQPSPTNTPSTPQPSPTNTPSTPPNSINEFFVVTDDISQMGPQVWGNIITWHQQPSTDTSSGDGGDVLMYDVSSGIQTRLGSDQTTEVMPRIQADRIVWVEADAKGGEDIRFVQYSLNEQSRQNLSLLDEYTVFTGGTILEMQGNSIAMLSSNMWASTFDLSENYLVWSELEDTDLPYTIFAHDLKSNETFAVIELAELAWYPRTSGDMIVWFDGRDERRGIHGFNGQTGEEQALVESNVGSPPDISGSILVWRDISTDPGSIRALNLQTGETWTLSSQNAKPGDPVISGDFVVWADWRNGNADIYGYHLPSRSEFQITNDPAAQVWPDVDGNLVVWMDARSNEQYDIYAASLQWE